MNHHTNTSRTHLSGVLEQDRDRRCLITDLPFGPLAAAAARSAVTAALTGTEPGDLANEAQLAGSEMVANAIQRGTPPLVFAVECTSGPDGWLDVEITVTDGGCDHDKVRRTRAVLPADDMESGRGLVIVQALAAAWSLTVGTQSSRAWCRLLTTRHTHN